MMIEAGQRAIYVQRTATREREFPAYVEAIDGHRAKIQYHGQEGRIRTSRVLLVNLRMVSV